MLESEENEIVERAITVTADRVDALVSRPNFHELSNIKAFMCLKQCITAALMETDHISYKIKSKVDKKRIYVNIKFFENDNDFDVQLRYSISGEPS
jgi:hypothetical protein